MKNYGYYTKGEQEVQPGLKDMPGGKAECGCAMDLTNFPDMHILEKKFASGKESFMNFVFISPNFPHTYWQFCDRLNQQGIRVLGIGDQEYDALSPFLRSSLTEYYKVNTLEDYDQV